MMDTLRCLRVRPIGSYTNSQHRLIDCYPNSLPNSVCRNEELMPSSPLFARLPRLVLEHPAASDSSRHQMQRSIQYWRDLTMRCLESGDKRFSLMKRWFYSIIGFDRAAQIQEGNKNVVRAHSSRRAHYLVRGLLGLALPGSGQAHSSGDRSIPGDHRKATAT